MAKWNLFVQTVDLPGEGRMKQGDIVFVQPEKQKINTRDLSRYIIVQIDGLTADEAYRLQELHYSDGSDGLVLKTNIKDKVTVIAKRKHSIPIAKMQDQIFAFDKARMEDQSDPYQPYLLNTLVKEPKTEATIYDKAKEAYRVNFSPVITPTLP